MPYKLRVLGPPEVLDEAGKPVPLSLGKPLALLIYVAASSSPVSRDELAALFWPDADRKKGRHSVRQALWVLKNALAEEIMENDDPLLISDRHLDLDLDLFLQALAEGNVEDARSLWRGPVLEHFGLAGVREWNRWVEDLRADLERRFSSALLRHAQGLAKEGDSAGALAALDQAITVAPSAQAPHMERVNLLLDLADLDRARNALADARQAVGDRDDASRKLAALEARLERVMVEQRIQVDQGETFPMEFVGRSREMASLHGLWREVNHGRSRVAVISGPSGMGKTRLAQELLAHFPSEESETVSIRGTRGERKLRWGAASDLVRQLLRLPGSAAISIASDSLLRSMLPSMGREAARPQQANGINPAAVLDAAMDLLEAVAFEAPLAVYVDDLQWVDPESRTLLMGLANRCRELRVLFLLAGRSDLSSRHWDTLEETLVTDAGARRFQLEPLIEEEVGELLALSATFEDSDDAVRVVRSIHQSSAGNPLFIRAILEELHEQGALRKEETGWVFEASAIPETFEMPENIRNLLKERMDRISEAGATVAATLARTERRLSSDALQDRTQLPANVFTQAVAELLERGVVEWTDGTRLDFVHDLLREAAATHLGSALPNASGESHRPFRTSALVILAAGILLALPLGILWGSGSFPWQKTGDPPPFGGGEIVFTVHGTSGPLAGVAVSPRPSEWAVTETIQRPSQEAVQYFPGPDGNLVWFGILTDPLGPDMIQILPDGAKRLFFPGPGDQSLRDLSPDGSRILFFSENVDSELFSQSLFQGWLESEEKELLYEGHGPLGDAQWSPNGDLISFSVPGPKDTLVVIARDRSRVGSVALDNISGFTWCGTQIVAAAGRENRGSLLRIQIPGMALDTVAEIVPGPRPSCSPDGTALVYLGVVDRQLVPLVMNLETGAILPLDFLPSRVENPTWLQRPPDPIPLRFSQNPGTDTVRLSLGEGTELPVSLLMSDGSRSTAGIRLRSMNPRVAVSEETRRITATGPGRTSIVAEWGYSLKDTVVVEVEADGSQGPLFRDPFHTLDTARWIPMGAAPRVTTTEAGERVLQIQGQAKYADGLILGSPVFLDQGLTVELELKANLVMKVHENITLCLLAGEPRREMAGRGMLRAPASACIHYPAHELSKFDPAEAYISVQPGRIRTVRVPEILPADDWVHMAIQIRADGEVSLVMEGQRVAANPVVLQTQPGQGWTLVLQGDAVRSEIFVRNLAVWAGERY